MHDLLVEDLPGELPRLVEDFPTVFGIGVVAEVGAFVDEALAVCVDDDPERIAVLLEVVADGQVAEMRRVAFPADRMASRPITPGHGADVERHLYAFAHVVRSEEHTSELQSLM